MNDALLYVGFVLGMLYGMVFFLVAFAFFMRMMAQLRHHLLQKGEAPVSPIAKKPPAGIRKSNTLVKDEFITYEEYIRKVNSPTQPIRRQRPEQL